MKIFNNKQKEEDYTQMINYLQDELRRYCKLANWTDEQFQANVIDKTRGMGKPNLITWLKNAIISQLRFLIPRLFASRTNIIREYHDKFETRTYANIDDQYTVLTTWVRNIPSPNPFVPQQFVPVQPAPKAPIPIPTPTPATPETPAIVVKSIPLKFTPPAPLPPGPPDSSSPSPILAVTDHIKGFDPKTLPEDVRVEMQVQFTLMVSAFNSSFNRDYRRNQYVNESRFIKDHIDFTKWERWVVQKKAQWTNLDPMIELIGLAEYIPVNVRYWNMNLIYHNIEKALTKTWTYQSVTPEGIINTQEDYWTFLVRGQILTGYHLLCQCLSDNYKYEPIVEA